MVVGGARASQSDVIDALHRVRALWKGEQRREQVRYLAERELVEDAPSWKRAQALFEVLPRGGEDCKRVSSLQGERQTVKSEAGQAGGRATQHELGFEGERA